METAVIKVGEVDRYDSGEYAHFKDASGKAWNCNEGKYIRNAKDGKPIFSSGRRLKVAYKTSEPKDGYKYGAKWINEIGLAEDSEQLTWPDREPYAPGSGRKEAHAANDGSRDKHIALQTVLKCWAEMYAGKAEIPLPSELAANVLATYEGVFEAATPLVEEAQQKLDAVPVNESFPPDDF